MARKRASMREGPLAELFRATEAAQRQAQRAHGETPGEGDAAATEPGASEGADPGATERERAQSDAATEPAPSGERQARGDDRAEPGASGGRSGEPEPEHDHAPEPRHAFQAERAAGERPRSQESRLADSFAPAPVAEPEPAREQRREPVAYEPRAEPPVARWLEPLPEPPPRVHRASSAGAYLAVIRVVGVGGAGLNAIDRMIDAGISQVDFIALNTDIQQLELSDAPTKIHIGRELTEGLGSGADPGIGRRAADESFDQIKRALRGSDMVFVTAGEGG